MDQRIQGAAKVSLFGHLRDVTGKFPIKLRFALEDASWSAIPEKERPDHAEKKEDFHVKGSTNFSDSYFREFWMKTRWTLSTPPVRRSQNA